MRPESKRNRADQFTPKYRHFHPQAVLFMRNPFSYDIVFRVADEHNVPYNYRLPAGQICELPGGIIATLGLKEVVDRMIGDNGTDLVRIWDPLTRAKYEDKVIVKLREAPQLAAENRGGEISLGTTEADMDERANTPQVAAEEPAFPGARRDDRPEEDKAVPNGKPSRSSNSLRGGAKARDPELAAVAAASLPAKNQVIEED